jgi:hypothetical protein
MGRGKLCSYRPDFDRGCFGDGVHDSHCSRHRYWETQVVLRRTIVGTDEVVVFEDSLTHILVSQIYREPQFGEEPPRGAAKSITYLRPCLLGSG